MTAGPPHARRADRRPPGRQTRSWSRQARTHALDQRQAVDRRGGTRGDIYNPATGRVSGTVDYATAAEVDAAVAAGSAALPGWRETSLVKRAGVMFAFRELVRSAAGGPGRADHRRARQGGLGRGGRGGTRPGGRGLRLRHPASAQGRLLGERVGRRGRLLDPPAGRRRGRDHAVQLPGDGADVDVPDRAGLRQHLRAQAVGEGPVGLAAAGRAAGRGRACRTARSTSCTAPRRRWTRC